MSVELIVEVLKHAPADLNPTERLTLVAIAESCRLDTRTTHYRDGWDAEELARRVGVTAESLTKVFRSLARKGVEVRVAQAVKDGKPVFAFKGRQTTFRLPRFAPQRVDDSPVCDGQSPDEGPPFGAGAEGKDWTSVRERLDESPGFGPQRVDESPPLSLKELPSKNPSTSLSPRQLDPQPGAEKIEREMGDDPFVGELLPITSPERLIAKRDITSDMITPVRDWITDTCQVRGPGWWITVDRNGTLDQHIRDALADLTNPSGYRRTAVRSPADQRVADGATLYAKYRAREHEPFMNPSLEDCCRLYDPTKL